MINSAKPTDKADQPDQRYTRAYEWLWGNPPGNDGTPATLRLHIRDDGTGRAQHAVDAWLTTLEADPTGTRGRGGWHIDSVQATDQGISLDLTSSGEDVAEAIEDAANSAHDFLTAQAALQDAATQLTWEEMPRL